VLLEFARKRMRIFQEAATAVSLAPSDLRSLVAALAAGLAHPPAALRAADFGAPDNPRHLALLHQKLAALLPAADPGPAESGEG
jgi:hypothetical protein